MEAGSWLCVLPCAVVTIAVVVLLGPPLAHVLYPAPLAVLPTVEHHPEPLKDTRLLLAMLGPVLLVASIALVAPRVRLARRPGIALVRAVQLAGVAVVVTCIVRQEEPGWRPDFFSAAQIAGAIAGTAALVLAARRGWLTSGRSDSRATRALVIAIVLIATGIWFLWLLNTADSIYRYGSAFNTGFMFDETFAVLNGLTPLVNFNAAYGSLSTLLFAPVLALLGKTLLVWTIVMWALSVAMLLALYGVLRRVTNSAIGALALYLPVMAFVFRDAWRDHPPVAIYQQVPLRNAAPFLVAWLAARRLDRGRGATWPLAMAGGLAALNNVDFGLAALGATVAALVWAGVPLSRQAVGRLVAAIAIGVAGALALVAVVTLLRAGALPNPLKAIALAQIFHRAGIAGAPLQQIVGLPLLVYLTYGAALGVATVRALAREPDRTLTGMLAWSGVFGFGSSVYFWNASVPLGIPTLFPAWGLALALLAVAAVRRIARARERWPTAPALLAVFGISLIATYVAMPPPRLAPWSQVQRLGTEPHGVITPDAEPMAPPSDPKFVRFVSAIADGQGHFVVKRGAPVAFLSITGHVLADAYGLKDVVPYPGEDIFTATQLDDTIRRLRAAGGNTVLVPAIALPRVSAHLVRRGFAVLTTSGPRAGVPGQSIPLEAVVAFRAEPTASQFTKWVDLRALRGGSSE